jgi:hypothetical protein
MNVLAIGAHPDDLDTVLDTDIGTESSRDAGRARTVLPGILRTFLKDSFSTFMR